MVLDGMNAERILIAAECIGDARYFIKKARDYANERVVFDRPIGKNQGLAFPLAEARMRLDAAELMIRKATGLRFSLARSFNSFISRGLFVNDASLSLNPKY